MVDLGGDAVGLAPFLHELIEPDIMKWHEVTPEEDAETGTGDVGSRRRLPQRRAGAFEDRSSIGPSGQKGSQPIVSHHFAPLRLRARRRGSCQALTPGLEIESSPIRRVKRA